MASATYRERQRLLAREIDRGDDIRRTGASHDEPWTAIDQPVLHRSRVVIPGSPESGSTRRGSKLSACTVSADIVTPGRSKTAPTVICSSAHVALMAMFRPVADNANLGSENGGRVVAGTDFRAGRQYGERLGSVRRTPCCRLKPRQRSRLEWKSRASPGCAPRAFRPSALRSKLIGDLTI